VAPGRRSARASAQGYLTQLEGNISVTSNRSVTRDIVLTKADPKARFAFHGVGAVLRKDGDDVLIQSLIDGSPAAAYGLKEGDRIVSVDGDATSGMTLGHIVERIRGEEGAAVRMEVDREGEGRLTVEITRGRVVVRDDINVGDR
jgi:C-terminal processing protease CtpA/Prc